MSIEWAHTSGENCFTCFKIGAHSISTRPLVCFRILPQSISSLYLITRFIPFFHSTSGLNIFILKATCWSIVGLLFASLLFTSLFVAFVIMGRGGVCSAGFDASWKASIMSFLLSGWVLYKVTLCWCVAVVDVWTMVWFGFKRQTFLLRLRATDERPESCIFIFFSFCTNATHSLRNQECSVAWSRLLKLPGMRGRL